MSSGVKLIFKILVGTVVVMALGCLLIEFYNVNMTSIQINRLTDLGVTQGCKMFAQETYKLRDDDAGTREVADVIDYAGGIVCSGAFYGSGSPEQIYHQLYKSSEFKSWCSLPEIDSHGNWLSIKVLNHALNGASAGDYVEYEELGQGYTDVLMTPLNMGVPYIDQETLERMTQWNIAKLMSSNEEGLVHPGTDSEAGRAYVLFKGFRIYVQDIQIISMNYRVFDLKNSVEAQEFEAVTHISPDGLGIEATDSMVRADIDERTRIGVVGVQYSVPVAYEGLTPIKSIFEYAWNNQVEGLNSDHQTTVQEFDNSTPAALAGGGFGGSVTGAGVLPVPGKVTYYIVR